MKPGKIYRRQNSFTDEETEAIWKVRHLQTKEVLHLFPKREPWSINYLRRKTGAYRVFSHGGILRRNYRKMPV